MKRRRRPSRRLIAAAVVIGCLGLAAAAEGQGVTIRFGDIVIHANGGFTPEALPKHEDAPVTIYGGGSISTVLGDLPPVLRELMIEFDRHGAVETRGLQVCTKGRLEATTTVQARRSCPEAIVGKGGGTAVVKFPEQKAFRVSSPLTLFNGPRVHGDPTVLAHAYLAVPAPTTYIVPIVIERIHHGAYGYRTKATIPRIAGGYGIPIAGHLRIGRRWTYRGRRHSYVNARCENSRLEARGEFRFSDGSVLTGRLVRPCLVRP